MTIRNRETLRHFFDEGRMPTRDNFADLIDSMLNMSDEGFRKSPENGVEVSTPVGHDALLSFYREQSSRSALWSVSYGGDRDQLLFNHGGVHATRGQAPVLSLDGRDRVGIGTADPREALDVAGVVAARGWQGTYRRDAADADAAGIEAAPLLADGEWHDLTPSLTGCQGFDVVAGAGHPGAGRYAVMRASALNAYNPTAGWLEALMSRKRIRAHHAWYGRRCDQLQLRWLGTSGRNAQYTLQIRTRCDYGPGVRIQAHVTQLWFDATMEGSAP